MRTIYFDMDGTIADLYGVNNWLRELELEKIEPYEKAEPLHDLERANELLNELQCIGFNIGVISWTAKNGTKEYNARVRKAKKEWLQAHFTISFDEVHIVKYGTPKYYVAKDKRGIIFDDDERVRNNWKGIPINPNEKDICKVLEELIENGI